MPAYIIIIVVVVVVIIIIIIITIIIIIIIIITITIIKVFSQPSWRSDACCALARLFFLVTPSLAIISPPAILSSGIVYLRSYTCRSK